MCCDDMCDLHECFNLAWTKTKNSLTTISKLVPSSNLNNSSCNFKVEIPDRGNIGSSCSDATSRTLPTIVTSGCFREKPFVSGGSVDAGVSIIKASLVEGGKQPAHAAVNSSDKYCYGTITYEYHAYEAIFATAIALYKQDYSHISRISEELIPQMQRGGIFPFDIQKQMAFLKNKVSTALSRARAFQVCLNTLIDDDESMSLMSLTLLSEKPNLYEVS